MHTCRILFRRLFNCTSLRPVITYVIIKLGVFRYFFNSLVIAKSPRIEPFARILVLFEVDSELLLILARIVNKLFYILAEV